MLNCRLFVSSVTADDVKSLLLGMAGEQTTLLSYFRTFIENFAKRVGVNRTEGSLRSYRNAYNHVERFMWKSTTCRISRFRH